MWPFYLRVGESTRLITGSTQMNRVLDEPGQISTRIGICKKISTQPDPNPWWVRLTRGFQPILTHTHTHTHTHIHTHTHTYIYIYIYIYIHTYIYDTGNRAVKTGYPTQPTTCWWFSEPTQLGSLFSEPNKFEPGPIPPRVGGLNGLAHGFT